jgi:hypothetical protein
MTAAIVTLVFLFVLAAVVGPPVLGLVRLIVQVVMGLAAFAYRVLSGMFVIGGYVVALVLWGIWLCVDRRGALEAYRTYPRAIGLRD